MMWGDPGLLGDVPRRRRRADDAGRDAGPQKRGRVTRTLTAEVQINTNSKGSK
jgi:hypothetical protein